MLPTILAIDTATEICSVALASGGKIVSRSEDAGQRHSEMLLPMVTQLLRTHDATVYDCDAIAFGAGPGSFTGLRIACGVAQGLAYGAGKPVVPVGNLHALAWGVRSAGRRILAAIDARMNEAYCAVFDVDGDVLATRLPPSLVAATALPQLCRVHRPDVIAGNALLRLDIDRDGLGQAAQVGQARAEAGTFAELGSLMFSAGLSMPPADAVPLYVRDRVAMTIEERRARSAAAA